MAETTKVILLRKISEVDADIDSLVALKAALPTAPEPPHCTTCTCYVPKKADFDDYAHHQGMKIFEKVQGVTDQCQKWETDGADLAELEGVKASIYIICGRMVEEVLGMPDGLTSEPMDEDG